MYRSFQAKMQDFMNWSLRTFKKSTTISCLRHLETEIKEIEDNVNEGKKDVVEWVDALNCILSGAARDGFSVEDLEEAFERKFAINKQREWAENADGTYSHIRGRIKTKYKQVTLGEVKVGDKVFGTWRDPATMHTYNQEGLIEQHPAGLFVVSDKGATALNHFITISIISD